MSIKRFSITILCFPYKYLPFPIDFIPKYFFKTPKLCGDECLTLFVLTDLKKIDPSLLFYSLDEAKKAYKAASQSDLEESETLKAEIEQPDDFNVYLHDFDSFEIQYKRVYTPVKQQLLDHEDRMRKAITEFTNEIFNSFNEFLDNALHSLPDPEHDGKSELNNRDLNTSEKLREFKKRI